MISITFSLYIYRFCISTHHKSSLGRFLHAPLRHAKNSLMSQRVTPFWTPHLLLKEAASCPLGYSKRQMSKFNENKNDASGSQNIFYILFKFVELTLANISTIRHSEWRKVIIRAKWVVKRNISICPVLCLNIVYRISPFHFPSPE